MMDDAMLGMVAKEDVVIDKENNEKASFENQTELYDAVRRFRDNVTEVVIAQDKYIITFTIIEFITIVLFILFNEMNVMLEVALLFIGISILLSVMAYITSVSLTDKRISAINDVIDNGYKKSEVASLLEDKSSILYKPDYWTVIFNGLTAFSFVMATITIILGLSNI